MKLYVLSCSQCKAPIAFMTTAPPMIDCMCRVCADAYAQVATAVGTPMTIPETEIHNCFLQAFEWRHNVQEHLADLEVIYQPIVINIGVMR